MARLRTWTIDKLYAMLRAVARALVVSGGGALLPFCAPALTGK
jgi:hypothetical protein